MGIFENAMGFSWYRSSVIQFLVGFILYLSLVHTTEAAATCDAATYGKPRSSDCTTIFPKIIEGQDLRSRLFVEEQLRSDGQMSWPGVDNPFIPSVVQVPRYYSSSTCNFAIMPYTNPNTHSMLPMGITSWGSIKVAGTQLMADCLKSGKNSGGEIFVRDKTANDPTLVLWMWASGANFEATLNQYENDRNFSPQLSNVLGGAVGDHQINGTLLGAGAKPNVIADTPVSRNLTLSNSNMSSTGSIETS